MQLRAAEIREGWSENERQQRQGYVEQVQWELPTWNDRVLD